MEQTPSKSFALRTALISPVPALAADLAASFCLSFFRWLDRNDVVPQRLAAILLSLLLYACFIGWRIRSHRKKPQLEIPIKHGESETGDEEHVSVLPGIFLSAFLLMDLLLFWMGPGMMAVNILMKQYGTPGIAVTICWIAYTLTILPSIAILNPIFPIVSDTPVAIVFSRRGKAESVALDSVRLFPSQWRPLPPLPIRFLAIFVKDERRWSGLVLESSLERLMRRAKTRK